MVRWDPTTGFLGSSPLGPICPKVLHPRSCMFWQKMLEKMFFDIYRKRPVKRRALNGDDVFNSGRW